MKNTVKNLILIGIFGGLIFGPFFALAAEPPSRYFIKSESSFWRNAFGTRHAFDEGFSSDLADWQVRFGRFFGLDIEPVVSLFILPESDVPLIGPQPEFPLAEETEESDIEEVESTESDDSEVDLTESETLTEESSEAEVLSAEDTESDDSVLEETEADKSAEVLDSLDNENLEPQKKDRKAFRFVPSDPTPWGIEAVYQDGFIQETSGGTGVTVAIVDTGILTSHPDLGARVKECKDFSSRKAEVIDGGCDDKNGHGTHIAGIIAADGGVDKLGIYGMAPGADLFAYKVCSSSGFCYADDIALAMKMAVDNGANIINISLGSDTASPLIFEAVKYAADKGVLLVAAAGNDGSYFESLDYPAAHKEVIGVGAFDIFTEIPDWSSRGINSTTTPYVDEDGDIEFAMPGVNIESTWKNENYAILSGTSMASPFLTGLAAKYWQFEADNPAEATRLLLHDLATDIHEDGDDDASGWGAPGVFIGEEI